MDPIKKSRRAAQKPPDTSDEITDEIIIQNRRFKSMNEILEARESAQKPPDAPELPDDPIPGLLDNFARSQVAKLKELSRHKMSSSLPINPYVEEAQEGEDDFPVIDKRFEQASGLQSYDSSSKYYDEIKLYEVTHPGRKKRDGSEYGFNEGMTGWKLHLNVKPEDASHVSTYLRENGYRHKFLSGGMVTSGKVFTIYIGSRELTQRLSQELSKDLEKFLCRPADWREIEFAKGIVGRFSSGDYKEDFSIYGPYGMPELAPDWNDPFKKETDDEKALKAYKKLKTKFGKYFGW